MKLFYIKITLSQEVFQRQIHFFFLTLIHQTGYIVYIIFIGIYIPSQYIVFVMIKLIFEIKNSKK